MNSTCIVRVLKLLSEDPSNYKDAPREGIRRILEEVTGKPHPREAPVDTRHIDIIRMGTTVATNALLERKGERWALNANPLGCRLGVVIGGGGGGAWKHKFVLIITFRKAPPYGIGIFLKVFHPAHCFLL